MSKIAAAGVTALCASILCTTPYSFRVTPEGSVSLSLDSAAAVIGRPLTPMSIAGVHRRRHERSREGLIQTPDQFRHVRRVSRGSSRVSSTPKRFQSC